MSGSRLGMGVQEMLFRGERSVSTAIMATHHLALHRSLRPHGRFRFTPGLEAARNHVNCELSTRSPGTALG
jgi:hypothetical protein